MTTMNFMEAVKAATPSTPTEPLVAFGPLRVEARAEYSGSAKTLYTFDQAQAALATKDLVLPTFRQVMEHVIIPGLEHTLSPGQQNVFDDLFKSYGEWTDNAFYRKGNLLYVSTGIKGLVRNGADYCAGKMTVDATPTAYDITDLPSQEWLSLERVTKRSPALINDLYSKPFGQLPRRIKKDAGLYLPPEGVVRPVGRGVYLVASSGRRAGSNFQFHRKQGFLPRPRAA